MGVFVPLEKLGEKKNNHTPRSWGKKIKGKRRKVREEGKRGAALNYPKNQ